MLANLNQFTRKLTDSGLMSVEQLETFCETLPPNQKPQTAEELSRQLVENRVLTEYQVDVLLGGAANRLVLGDYAILEQVGVGGMGVVFRAEHRRMKRAVALKMLPKEVDEDKSAVRRFEREVEIAAKLSHPNIVAALDAREEQGTHYLIMEYVEGRDLFRIVENDGTLTVEKAVSYVIQTASGCAYAHQLGVIHRDIKPSNLLVDADDVVKILDMGLARVALSATEGLVATQSHLTSPGIVMGTIDFMSPEQALSSHNVDHRTDIYSLGCTLYYLLVGRPIYAGNTPIEKLVAHREQPIPSLRDARADVSAALDATYRRMVAKRVQDRFQSMSEASQALCQCLSTAADTGTINRLGAWATADDGHVPVLAEVVEESTPEVTNIAAGSDPGSGSHRDLGTAPIRTLRGAFLVLVGKLSGAILGCIAGADLGSVVGGPAAVIGALFYVWFGWRCGSGYAWMLAYSQGWSNIPPDTAAGQLFQPRKLKWHAAAVLTCGTVGFLTGGLWRGIFLGLTLLAVADRLQAKWSTFFSGGGSAAND